MRRLLALLSIGLAAMIAGCQSAPKHQHEERVQRFEFEEPQMGVPFRLVFYASDTNLAERAAEAAFARVAELNHILSDYETDSEISRLSRSSEEGSPEVPLSPDLWNVLAASQKLGRETGGAFDVTVGPCVALWRKARREHELPDPARLASARSKTGFTSLVLYPERHSARLLKRGMRLDVGGIAKGYAADEAREVLRKFGIERALVAASGDISLGSPPPDAPGWRVELIGYDRPGGPPALTASLANCGVSSSGDLFQFVEINGVRYSHILDPFTCVGMTNHALSVVVAPSGKLADSLDTAMVLLEPKKAMRLAAKYNTAVRIVRLETNGPAVYVNSRFRKLEARAQR